MGDAEGVGELVQADIRTARPVKRAMKQRARIIGFRLAGVFKFYTLDVRAPVWRRATGAGEVSMQSKTTSGVGHRTTSGRTGRRAFALFACALMLLSLVPQPALAQATPPPGKIAVFDVAIEEQILSHFNQTGHINTTGVGRVIVNNTESEPVANVSLRFKSTGTSNLPSVVTVPSLPPGESVVATYNFTATPSFTLSHESKSITYLEFIETHFQTGEISPVGRQIALAEGRFAVLGLHENLLEFNLTVTNAGNRNLTNLTLADILPNQTVNGSLVAFSSTAPGPDPHGGALVYNPTSDTLLIPRLQKGTGTRLTFQATLPQSVVADPGVDYIDMRHPILASYGEEVVATQELQRGRTPEQERQLENRRLAIELEDTLRRVVGSLDASELTEVLQTLESEAWSLPEKLRAEAFSRARNLGIPVDTDPAYGNELDRQVKERWKEVLARLPALMDQFRMVHERKIEDYAKIAGSLHKVGVKFQESAGRSESSLNETQRRQTYERIATHGYTEDTKRILRAEGFTDAQISEMQNATAQQINELARRNLTQIYDLSRDTYIHAIRDSTNLSVRVLENSMFFNREANLTKPLTQAWLELLDLVQGRAEIALNSRNWSELEPAARDLMAMLFYEGLRTGAPLLAQKYRNATVAWAAAVVASSGDPEAAARMVEGLSLESHFFVQRLSALNQVTNPNTDVTVRYSVGKVVVRALTFTIQASTTAGVSANCPSTFTLAEAQPSGEFSCTTRFPSVGNFQIDVSLTTEGETIPGGSTFVSVVSPTPTPTPTASPTASPGVTPTPSPGFTPTPSPGVTPTPTPTATPTPGPTPTPTPVSTISGKVTDQNGALLTGIIVTANGQQTTTAAGAYSLTVPQGGRTVRFSAPAFTPVERSVSLPPNATIDVKMRLSQDGLQPSPTTISQSLTTGPFLLTVIPFLPPFQEAARSDIRFKSLSSIPACVAGAVVNYCATSPIPGECVAELEAPAVTCGLGIYYGLKASRGRKLLTISAGCAPLLITGGLAAAQMFPDLSACVVEVTPRPPLPTPEVF